MRTCIRCGYRKPDANFIQSQPTKKKLTKEHAKVRGMCLHCRTIGEQMPYNAWGKVGKAGMYQAAVQPIEPTPEDQALIDIARKERELSKERGRKDLVRPYSKNGEARIYDVYPQNNEKRGVPFCEAIGWYHALH